MSLDSNPHSDQTLMPGLRHLFAALGRRLPLVAIAGLLCATSLPARGADKAAINRAVSKGVQYLNANVKSPSSGELVAGGLRVAERGRTAEQSRGAARRGGDPRQEDQAGVYDHSGLNTGLYEAALDAMILVDIDPQKYQPQLKLIGDFYLRHQRDHGAWTYGAADSAGDTSVTQYALLGLWAVARAGVEIPADAWDRAIVWHLKNQNDDGGYAYKPGTTEGAGNGTSTLNMSAAAAGAIGIAAMHLYPENMPELSATTTIARTQSSGSKKFGILERRLPPDPEAPGATTRPTGPFKPSTSFSEVQQRLRRSIGWVSGNFEARSTAGYNMYYYYCLERMAALAEVTELGGVDWFNACADVLLKDQLAGTGVGDAPTNAVAYSLSAPVSAFCS